MEESSSSPALWIKRAAGVRKILQYVGRRDDSGSGTVKQSQSWTEG